MTDSERLLWQGLRNRQLGGFKFRRQKPIGPFIVDFVCMEKKLIIEVDGSQHAGQKESDQKRSYYLMKKGFRVLRFWNNEVLQESDAVFTAIFSALSEHITPHPNPLPSRGEGVKGQGNLSFCQKGKF